MANRDLLKRFQQAFENPDKVRAEEYQKTIEEIASKAAEKAERLTFLLLSLVMIFVLVTQGRIKKLDLGFVEIDDPSIILVTLPVLIAYIHYDLVTTLAKFDRLAIMYKVIIEKRHKSIYDQRLTEYFLITPSLYESKYLSTAGIAHKIQSSLWVFQFLSITIFVPLGFYVMAFWKLFTLPVLGFPLLLIVSLAITTLFALQSFFTAAELLRGVSEN